jgi:hypothetical protein
MFYDIYLYTLCYYICCLLGACMRCTRLCSLKPGVTLHPLPFCVHYWQAGQSPDIMRGHFFSARSTLPRGPHTSGARPVDLLGPSASQLLREPRDDQTNSAMEGRGVITEVPQPPAATPSPCSPINSRVLWIHCLCRREKRERERARELGGAGPGSSTRVGLRCSSRSGHHPLRHRVGHRGLAIAAHERNGALLDAGAGYSAHRAPVRNTPLCSSDAYLRIALILARLLGARQYAFEGTPLAELCLPSTRRPRRTPWRRRLLCRRSLGGQP